MKARSKVRSLTVIALLAGCSADGALPQNDRSHTASRSLTDRGSSPPPGPNGGVLPVAIGEPESEFSERDIYSLRSRDGSCGADVAGAGPSGAASEPLCGSDAPGRSYVGRSADECSRINFLCVEGTTMFADDCGCGCAAE